VISTGVTSERDDRGIDMYEHLPAPPNTTTTDEEHGRVLATMPTCTAGWYPDPVDASVLRYHDGSGWTEHRHDPTPVPAPPAATAQPAGQQIVVNTYVAQSAGAGGGQPKSAALAFVLTFFFGPFGMLYSTVAGGLIMLVVELILVPLTFGLALIILWPVQLVWAVVAASNANRQAAGTYAGPVAGGLANQVAR
jgi:hypothetical protein